MTKILVVDDEVNLLEVIKDYLQKEGYDVFTSVNGEEAYRLFPLLKPDFLILDLMLPGLSGEEICRLIRRESNVPVLMLTAKNAEEDRINGLALGADDYLVKPFSPRELVMRVKAILRRTARNNLAGPVLSFNSGDLEINEEEHTVRKKGQEVRLTPNEFSILLTLAKNTNRTFSRTQLIDSALGFDFAGYERTIDTHVKNIRQKIEDDYKEPLYVTTVYGIGYKFTGERL
ncbi:response regulator transcription factor [Dehalobacter sp. DCM]|uniref:response regulator transcription factor n=1 Tax=Dehalobacter sp. DCM TaxID=2907827 RepID=UPI003081E60F|nr:response regulator transcription factor [Dehalobacter sp. DCM]